MAKMIAHVLAGYPVEVQDTVQGALWVPAWSVPVFPADGYHVRRIDGTVRVEGPDGVRHFALAAGEGLLRRVVEV